MNKFSLSALVAASLVLISTQASAAAVGGDFTVSASLAGKCVNTNATVPDINFGAYTPFVGPASNGVSVNLTFKCTKNVTISGVALSAPGGTLRGVNYTLAVGAATTGTGAGGDTYSYPVTGTMDTLEPGDVLDLTTQQTRTLTISY